MRLEQCLNGVHFIEVGVGRRIQTSHFSYLTFPAPAPLFLALIRFQNTKHCCVIYPPPALSSPASRIPPAHILTISRLPVLLPHISRKGDIDVAK